MAHRASNKLRNRWTVGLLNLEPPQQVLEVGSGPGIALAQVAGCLTSGRIVGLDYSKTMHNMAANRNRQAIRDADFQNIRVESLESLSAIMNGPKGCGR